jgi:hypothetical protein
MLMAWTNQPPPLPEPPRITVQMIERQVGGLWRQAPASWPPEGKLQAVAQHFSIDDEHLQVADADGDGADDLIIASDIRMAEPPGYMVPTVVFRSADLKAGRVKAQVLPGDEGGFFRSWGPVGDLNLDGRRELAVQYGFGGSGDIRGWVVYQWDGRAFRRIFEARLDNWRGPTWIYFAGGRIGLTCRPGDYFAHHTQPHRSHVETWAWRNGQYRFVSHYAPPARTARQAVSDAERLFRRQEYSAAALLYRRALALPREPELDRDWAPYIHFRLGQIEGLLGHGEGARRELAQAAAAGGFIAQAVGVMQQDGLIGVMGLDREPEGVPGVAWFSGQLLAPPEVVLQAYLTEKGTAEGFPAEAILAADLDGDGRKELFVRPRRAYAEGEPADLLAVRTAAGWRVGRVSTASGTDPTVVRRDHRRVIRVNLGGGDVAELGWDGKLVHHLYGQKSGFSSRSTHPLLEPLQERCLQE